MFDPTDLWHLLTVFDRERGDTWTMHLLKLLLWGVGVGALIFIVYLIVT